VAGHRWLANRTQAIGVDWAWGKVPWFFVSVVAVRP
jgi:hypothetical protein